MTVQLPEPDYYELAEVAKSWDVSESYLMRLAAEGKLELAWPIQGSIWVSVTSDFDHPETVEEVENLFPSLPPGHLCFRIARKAKRGLEGHESLAIANSHARVMHELWRKTKWDKIEISVSGLAIISTQSFESFDNDSLGSTSFARVSHFTGTKNTAFDPPNGRVRWRYEIRESTTSRGGILPQLPDGYYGSSSDRVGRSRPMGPGKGCMGRCMDIVNRRRHSPCRPKHIVGKHVVPRQCLT